MTAPYIVNESDKSLMSSVQLWMSRLQLVTVVVSAESSTDRGFQDSALMTIRLVTSPPLLSRVLSSRPRMAYFSVVLGLLSRRIHRLEIPSLIRRYLVL